MERIGQNQRQHVCFVQFARWRHRELTQPSPTASCLSLPYEMSDGRGCRNQRSRHHIILGPLWWYHSHRFRTVDLFWAILHFHMSSPKWICHWKRFPWRLRVIQCEMLIGISMENFPLVIPHVKKHIKNPRRPVVRSFVRYCGRTAYTGPHAALRPYVGPMHLPSRGRELIGVCKCMRDV